MEHYRNTILNAIGQGIMLLDASGVVRFCNPSARHQLDIADGDIGKPLHELAELYPLRFWQETLTRADVMLRRNGVEQQCMATTYATDGGIVLCLDWERVQVEDEFRFFIMDNMSEGVVLLDAHGAVLYMNSAAKMILSVGLHAGSSKYWTMENLGEFRPGDFWRSPSYKKEVLFIKGEYEVHLLASAYHQSDKVIVCLEEEKRETLRFIRQDTLAAADLDAMAGIGPELRKEAMMLANSDISFMITGESGTGKEMMARSVHYSSFRSKEPFVVIDCTALPEHLVESELFGYEPGSFTGARSDGRAGKFELADGGTIMLDEISELPLAMQPKLLRILNDQLVMRIGARKPKAVNVRVIACTNRDLRSMVERGLFREDLFYRLKGATLNLPPLRERMKYFDDLLALFLSKYAHGKTFRFSPQAHAVLQNFQWPGNIRELEKAVQYVLAQNPPELVPTDALPGDIMHGTMEMRAGKLKDMVRLHERMLVTTALQANRFNVTASAAKLGLTRMGLTKKIQALGIKTPSRETNRFPKRLARGNRASIEIIEVSPASVHPGGKITVKLNITNTGRTNWLDICKTRRSPSKHLGSYMALIEWFDGADHSRLLKTDGIPLPGQVKCGESIIAEASIKALAHPGHYIIIFLMAQVGVGSFLDKPLGNSAYNLSNFPTATVTIA